MLKTKNKAIVGVAGVVTIVSALTSYLLSQQLYAEQANTTFQIDVKDTLSVSIESPTGGYDEGDVGDLLTGQIHVSVASNNSSGFSTGIRASNQAATLVSNNGGTLSNLGSSVSGSSFPAGRWGYSLGDETPLSKTYSPLSAYNVTPTKIASLSRTSNGSAADDIYFAAKASYDNPAGTYTGTVNISVVSGSTSPDPGSNPVGPDDTPTPGSATVYHSGVQGGVTTHTVRSQSSQVSSEATTTITEISNGDSRSAYADPQGETEKTESYTKTNSSLLPVILATTSAVSAAAGLGFFIVAKRREEEDEEENELE